MYPHTSAPTLPLLPDEMDVGTTAVATLVVLVATVGATEGWRRRGCRACFQRAAWKDERQVVNASEHATAFAARET